MINPYTNSGHLIFPHMMIGEARVLAVDYVRRRIFVSYRGTCFEPSRSMLFVMWLNFRPARRGILR